jgi:hypothetical protein
MNNNYQEPEVFEIGRAQDIVLGEKSGVPQDSQFNLPTASADIDESDE